MMGMQLNLNTVAMIGAVLAVMAAIVIVLYIRSRKKTPEELERLRRFSVNATGRLADGILLVEGPADAEGSADTDLIFYQYRAAGMEYTAAQDISLLRHLVDSGSSRPGLRTAVKFDPRHPSNSIVICEEWSGLRRSDNARD